MELRQGLKEKNLENAYKSKEQSKLRINWQNDALEKLQEKDQKMVERVKELHQVIQHKIELEGEKLRLRFTDIDRKRSIQKTLEENEKEKIVLKHNLLKEKVSLIHHNRDQFIDFYRLGNQQRVLQLETRANERSLNPLKRELAMTQPAVVVKKL